MRLRAGAPWQERHVFCTAPANLHDRESSAELLRAAEAFAARRAVPLDALQGAGRTRVPATAEQLRRLEGLHSVRTPRPGPNSTLTCAAVRRSTPPREATLPSARGCAFHRKEALHAAPAAAHAAGGCLRLLMTRRSRGGCRCRTATVSSCLQRPAMRLTTQPFQALRARAPE